MKANRLLASTVFRRTLAMSLVMAVLATAMLAAVGWGIGRMLVQATRDEIAADAAELSRIHAQGGMEALALAVADRSRATTRDLYRLVDQQGRLRAGNLRQSLEPAIPAGGGIFAYGQAGGSSGAARTGAGLAIDVAGGARLVVARDVEDQRRLLAAVQRGIGVAGLALLLIGLAGSYFIARHALNRIEAMRTASRSIMAGNLAGRIPEHGSDDELDRLAGQLNDMLARIEQLLIGMREVSDNIAHDLRTPLNRLRNGAEAALADPGGAAAWRDGLGRIIEQADEMMKTFNALLLIARLEAGAIEESFETVDLAALARDVAELYGPAAEDAGFAISIDAPAAIEVHANRQLLGQALANLIDNAMKYGTATAGPAGGSSRVEIGVAIDGNDARLTIGDRGAGIAPEQRRHALGRFGRLETSRTRPGTGLGLSLVAAVARLHQGAVQLEDNRPGLKVVITLPLAAGLTYKSRRTKRGPISAPNGATG